MNAVKDQTLVWSDSSTRLPIAGGACQLCEKHDVGLTSKVPLEGGSRTSENAIRLRVNGVNGRSDNDVDGLKL